MAWTRGMNRGNRQWHGPVVRTVGTEGIDIGVDQWHEPWEQAVAWTRGTIRGNRQWQGPVGTDSGMDQKDGMSAA